LEDQRIKEILIEQNELFKTLFLQHQLCEEELHQYTVKTFKNDSEKFLEQELKKKKLLIKDDMQRLIIEYRERGI
jgi:uncharacterized protein YdcH (DUF465 family)